MNVILSIEGREAIPVRALAWLTGFVFGAQEVAEALAGDLDWPEVVSTYRLDGATVGMYERRLWANIHLVDLEHLTDKELDAPEWRYKSTQALPAGVFVWRDEWESAYNRSPDGPEALRELADSADDLNDVQDRTLNFDPDVPPELAALVMQWFDSPASEAGKAAPVAEPEQTPWHLLATPADLIAAFGTFTGMDKAWFTNAKDTPQLLAARHTAGQGGKNYREPLYWVFDVVTWLVDPKRRKGKSMSEATGWRTLKRAFPKVYAEYQDQEPAAD